MKPPEAKGEPMTDEGRLQRMLADTPEKVTATIGMGVKKHRAFVYHRADGTRQSRVRFACCCPGTASGRAAHRARIVADGWEAADCKN